MITGRRGRTDDAALVARAGGRDGIAVSALLQRHYPRLVLVAEGVVQVGWLAEYCAQEALSELLDALGGDTPWPRLQVQLYRRLLALALFRRAGAGTFAAAGDALPLPLAAEAVWLLHEHGGLSYAQIGKVVGCRAATVRHRLARARAALGGALAGRAPAGAHLGRAG